MLLLTFAVLVLALAVTFGADAGHCGAQYSSKATQLLKATRKEGVGILFVVHHAESEAHARFTRLALQSAASYQRSSPRVTRALVTSRSPQSILPDQHAFDRVIYIPDCLLVPDYRRSQKLTRTLSYHLTPFELTLAVDLDTFCCSDLYPVLERIFTQPRSFDMAANGHEEGAWHPDHGIKLFWWSARFRSMLSLWEQAQVELGIASSDQIALMHAVRTHPEANFRFGRLPTSMSCRIRPAFNESFAMVWHDRRFSQSLPIFGPLFILHMDGVQEFYGEVCSLVNANMGGARVLVFKHDAIYFPTPATFHKFFKLAWSQMQCDALLDGHCLPHLRWEVQPFAIEPVEQSSYVF